MRQDLRAAIRQLVSHPQVTLVAVMTLALGIGANAAVFSIVKHVLLEPLPLPRSDRLVQIWEEHPGGGRLAVSGLNVDDWREQNRTLQGLARYGCGRTAVVGGAEPLRAVACGVGRDFLDVLGVAPRFGPGFSPEDALYDGTPQVLVSHGYWQRQLGAVADLTGRELEIYGVRMPVVGVMPAGLDFPAGAEVWFANNIFPRPPEDSRSAHNYLVLARLRDGVSLAEAAADMDTLQKRIAASHPEADSVGARVVPLQEHVVGGARTALMITMGAAALVLLLACVNVANLLLARAAGRRQELAVRRAMGAGAGRLLRQFLVESTLLAGLGGLAGLLLARWLVSALPWLGPGDLPRLAEIRVDGGVLLAAMAVAMATAVLIGVAPAWQASRINLSDALKERGRGGAGDAGAGRVRRLLVVSQVALAVVLLVGAGLLTASLVHVLAVDVGFRPDRLLAMEIELPSSRYPDAMRRAAFFGSLEERARALPGVHEAGVISHVPLQGFTPDGRIRFDGRPDAEEEWGNADYRIISPGYFGTMGIPLVRGRLPQATDARDAPHVLLVNRAFAERYYPGEDPIGRRVQVAGFEPGQGELPPWLTIVGVVGDVRQRSLETEPLPETYVPLTQRAGFSGWSLHLVIRAERGMEGLPAALREQVREMDSNLPVTFRTLEDVVSAAFAGRRFQLILIGGFAAVGLLLAMIGVYGVISHAVSRRTGEIGIRMTLGARPRQILQMILRQGLALVALGAGIGLVGAVALTRLMRSLLFGVSATDPGTIAGVLATVVVVALLACLVPARRASRVDPMTALRRE